MRLVKARVALVVLLALGSSSVLVVVATSGAGEGWSGWTEPPQVLLMIDDSASMTEPASDPRHPGASRWELVRQAVPEWIHRIGGTAKLGAVSIGGECGGAPAILLQIGTPPAVVEAAVAAVAPDGQTNLSSALEQAATMFRPDRGGQRRIVLLSDGLNTCPPLTDTCGIARRLASEHGIRIDVVAWMADAQAVQELGCISSVSGGDLAAPQTLEELLDVPLPAVSLWPWALLGIGCLALIASARVVYRHLHHALGRPVGASLAAACLVFCYGLGCLALVVVAGQVRAGGIGSLAALLGLLIRGLISRRRGGGGRARPQEEERIMKRQWTGSVSMILVAVALLMAVAPASASAQQVSCERSASGEPQFHHILALDVSGSVTRYLDAMKALLACYCEMYTLPGETVTLLSFGIDEAGSVKEVRTFEVPPTGSSEIVSALLDDLKIQDPPRTKTYYRPLADYLAGFLHRVRLRPVVIVVSDGQSDAPQDTREGLIRFDEVSFEAFARRGMYSAPGIRDWKVAVQGGNGLDLTALFQRPITIRDHQRSVADPIRPAVRPCLIEPDLVVKTDEKVMLRPGFSPFARTVHGSLTLCLSNSCDVTRYRTFEVQLKRGGETLRVGAEDNMLIGAVPQEITYEFTSVAAAPGVETATVLLVVDEGGTSRTVYPVSPAQVVVQQVSYLGAHGLALAGLASLVCLVLTIAGLALRRWRRARLTAPVWAIIRGGPALALQRHRAVSVGGEPAEAVIPGAPDGVMATIEHVGSSDELLVRPAADHRLLVDGIEQGSEALVRFGRAIELVRLGSGRTIHLVLDRCTYRQYEQTIRIDQARAYSTSTPDIGLTTGTWSGLDMIPPPPELGSSEMPGDGAPLI